MKRPCTPSAASDSTSWTERVGGGWIEALRRIRATLGLGVGIICLISSSRPGLAQIPAEDSGTTDWAVSLPACAFGDAAQESGPLLLLYPRPGLPAVVEQGAALIARVRMPSALTPPPGHQQDSALRGFDAQLLASGGLALEGARGLYALRVAEVRPDAGASLVYRLRLPVPRWVAPGTYSLRIRAPSSGSRVSVASVRVVAAGRAPRLIALPPAAALSIDELRRRLRALEGYPADILVASYTPRLKIALTASLEEASWPPVLLDSGPRQAASLRVGERLVELGRCPRPREVSAQDPQRRRWTHDPALDRWWTSARRDEPVLRVLGASVVAASWLREPAELRLIVPEDGRATRVTGAVSASWWPGVTLFATAAAPSLLANLRLGPGVRATLRRGPGSPLSLRLQASSTRPATDQEVSLRAESERPARVAWQLAEDATAVGPEVQHRWALRDEVEVHALAIDAEGVPARASLRLRVDRRRDGLCSVRAPISNSSRPASGAVGLTLFVVLWTFRRRRHRMRPPRE
ncbi:MAG: hypothetical protein GXP55_22425 [Deltaproteobacteria bacterium]|nr:hypothetical protein [Deltaproteobacteria bacterium]